MGNKFRDSLTHYSPTRGFALLLGLGMLAWGVWVSLPFESFTGPLYDYMETLAVEAVWGALFLFGGLTLSVGTWAGRQDWISRGAFLGFMLWTAIAIMGTIADPAATPVVSRVLIALLHAWLYVQIVEHPELVSGEVKVQDLLDLREQRANAEINQSGGKHRDNSND